MLTLTIQVRTRASIFRCDEDVDDSDNADDGDDHANDHAKDADSDTHDGDDNDENGNDGDDAYPLNNTGKNQSFYLQCFWVSPCFCLRVMEMVMMKMIMMDMMMMEMTMPLMLTLIIQVRTRASIFSVSGCLSVSVYV